MIADERFNAAADWVLEKYHAELQSRRVKTFSASHFGGVFYRWNCQGRYSVPRLSILIPCLGESRQFENTLASVLQNRPADCEILVPHDQPYSDPYQLSGEVCFIQVPEAKSVVGLLNAGFEAARSAVVHVLQCGMEVSEGWSEAALAQFENDNVGLVSPVLVHTKSSATILAAGWNFTVAGRCHLSAAGSKLASLRTPARDFLGPTLAAGYYRRSLWRLLRWDASVIDELAPLALALAARELGAASILEPGSVVSSEIPLIPSCNESFGYHQAATVERFFWRETNQQANWGIVALHLGLLFVETLAALPSLRAFTGLLGRIAGALKRSEAAAYHERLAEVRTRYQMQQTEREQQSTTLPFPQPRSERVEKPEKLQKRAA